MTEVASTIASSTHLLEIFHFWLLFATVFSFGSRHCLSITMGASVCIPWHSPCPSGQSSHSCAHKDLVKWCKLQHASCIPIFQLSFHPQKLLSRLHQYIHQSTLKYMATSDHELSWVWCQNCTWHSNTFCTISHYKHMFIHLCDSPAWNPCVKSLSPLPTMKQVPGKHHGEPNPPLQHKPSIAQISVLTHKIYKSSVFLFYLIHFWSFSIPAGHDLNSYPSVHIYSCSLLASHK